MTIFSLRRHSRGLGLSPRRSRADSTAPSGDTEAPSVPQNLIATAVSSSQIELTWDASTDNVAVTGYKIYRDNVLADASPTNAYSDTGLASGTLYQYEVSAFDGAANESARSAPDSATTHQAIVTAGLLAEWRFDDGAGQQVTDHSGNGHHAQLGPTAGADSGEPVWSSTGLDMLLDGASFNNYVPIGSGLGLTGPDERTVCAVVSARFDNLGSTSFGYGILAWGPEGGSGDLWSLRIGASAKIGIQTAFGQAWNHPGTLTSDGWHFVAAVQDGPTMADVTIYLDGQAPFSDNVFSTAFTHAGDAFMGPPGAGMNGGFKAGRHAYMLVYNRALSAGEIEQNRQALNSILAGRGITLP